MPLPAHLPRREIRHEPTNPPPAACGCQMKRIGEDVAEKLDYVPVSSAWSATSAANGPAPSAKPFQAPVEAHVIDKGIPTTGLLAQVLVAKYADHLPLYRQGRRSSACRSGHPARPWRSGWAPAGWRLQPLVDALKDDPAPAPRAARR